MHITITKSYKIKSFQISTNVILIIVITVVKIHLVLISALVKKVITWLELADVLVN